MRTQKDGQIIEEFLYPPTSGVNSNPNMRYDFSQLATNENWNMLMSIIDRIEYLRHPLFYKVTIAGMYCRISYGDDITAIESSGGADKYQLVYKTIILFLVWLKDNPTRDR